MEYIGISFLNFFLTALVVQCLGKPIVVFLMKSISNNDRLRFAMLSITGCALTSPLARLAIAVAQPSLDDISRIVLTLAFFVPATLVDLVLLLSHKEAKLQTVGLYLAVDFLAANFSAFVTKF